MHAVGCEEGNRVKEGGIVMVGFVDGADTYDGAVVNVGFKLSSSIQNSVVLEDLKSPPSNTTFVFSTTPL